jgi:hypothetical protein
VAGVVTGVTTGEAADAATAGVAVGEAMGAVTTGMGGAMGRVARAAGVAVTTG